MKKLTCYLYKAVYSSAIQYLRTEKLHQTLLKSYQEEEFEITDTRLPKRKNILYRISAAAAAILVLATSVWCPNIKIIQTPNTIFTNIYSLEGIKMIQST